MSTEMPPAARLRVLVVFAWLLVAAGCRTQCAPRRQGDRRPNVVLVTIDTLRADHLGCYGNARVRTPQLDRLAAGGALFTRTYSQTHLTLPSHMTIFTSLPLAEHGVTNNEQRARRGLPTLPGVFAAAGYRTGAFVSAKHLGPQGGLGPALAPSFDTYVKPRRQSVPFRAEETNRRFFHWLRGVCREPFFAWIHYWDVHMPYTPPPPFDTMYYRGDPYDPRYSTMESVVFCWHFYDLHGVRPRLLARPAAMRALKRELGLNSRTVRRLVLHPEGVDLYARGRQQLAARAARRLQELADFVRRGLHYRRYVTGWLEGVRDIRFPLAEYAGEVSYADLAVGQLQDELERLGLARHTILVVTADHGESLGEHGVYFDHFGLYEPDLRVPLIVWAPGRVAAGRHEELARGLDIAPTVLRLAGLPVPRSMEGRDLFAAAPRADPVIAEAMDGLQLMIREGKWKLIRTLRRFHYVDAFAREAGSVELYDLEQDPDEHVNLADRRPRVVALLGADLAAWQAAHEERRSDFSGKGRGQAALSPQQLEELRALGYVE